MPAKEKIKKIDTLKDNLRESTQALMKEIWESVENGFTSFYINACGQHNIGGSIWSKNGEELNFYLKNEKELSTKPSSLFHQLSS